MHCTQKITEDLTFLGVNDRRLALFENIYPIPKGVSYNSYLLTDQKTVLLDTVDRAMSDRFLENLSFSLDGRELDYMIVNHMEPDHCAAIADIVLHYPNVKIVGNAKTFEMIKQFFNFDIDSRAVVVKEGDTLATGKHTLTFLMAPMVHWPEVMVTYDTTDKILFSADAFGTFGALSGNIFADAYNFECDCVDEARRYYSNIVGKYGVSVKGLLNKASSLDIKMICPLHGPIWRENIGWFIEKYSKWVSYTPEDNGVMIAYGSIYGNTENAAEILATELSKRGAKKIDMYDVSVTHPSYIVSEAFRTSHIVFAAPTFNGGIFTPMETLLRDLKAHNLQHRTVALIQNGTWAAQSAKRMMEIISEMKNMTILENTVSIKSSVKDSQISEIEALADAIVASLN